MMIPCIQHYLDPAHVAAAAAQRILKAADKAIAERGVFRIVLAGGTTPCLTYEYLAQAHANWAMWHIYFGDERCLPPGDEQRNDTLAMRVWLNQVPIPARQIYTIPAEQGPQVGAQLYAAEIASVLPFDLILLGMGEDGHTASLFPNQLYSREALTLAVNQAPKPPPQRVSLTPYALNQCRELLFLVTGRSKQTAVRDWLAGKPLPVSAIEPLYGATVLVDEAALHKS